MLNKNSRPFCKNTGNIIDQKKIILTYDSIANEYDKLYAKPSCHIKELLNYISKDSVVLDLGCGAGNNATYLSKMGYNVTGMDLSDNMITIAKNKKSDAKFIKGDVRKLNFKNDSCGSIISSYIFCHLSKTDVEKCLARFHDILRPGGMLFIESFTGNLGEITIPEPMNNALTIDFNIMAQNDIELLLAANNFKIIKFWIHDDTEFGLTGIQDTCIIAKKI